LTWPSRFAWGIAGVFWFLWLAYEDQGQSAVLLVSMLITIASGVTLLGRWLGVEEMSRKSVLIRSAMTGLGSGGAVGPFAAILITVKVALHAHPQADFTIEDVIQVLERIPIWAGAGLLVGLAGGLMFGFAYNERQEP
jgi:hypothetical protein